MLRQKINVLLVAVVTLVISLMGVLSGPVAAATNAGNGLTISPVRTDLTIEAGQTKTVSVFVQNVTKTTVTLQSIINDFTAGTDESGQPQILLNKNQYAPSHSLKRYVAPIGNITVGPSQQKEVKVRITIPKDAVPGGYFGVVRFAPASATSNGGNVSLAASVGSLILVTVPGNYKEQVSIASFDVRKNDNAHTVFTSNKSIEAVVRFHNTGDVQEQPFGKIELRHSGKTLATYEINHSDQPGNVLPDSIRKFSVPLTKLGTFGKYTLEGNFGYGSKGQLLTAKTTFYIIPLGLIIGVVVLILLILFAIFGLPKAIRAYNRRVMRRGGRR